MPEGPHSSSTPDTQRTSLGQLARLFLRLGTTAFGGPAAHVAMMQDEVVRRRRWLDEGRFLDLLGATNLIPGPNSTELAIHIGWQRAGWAGLVVAGVSFIAPSMLLTALFGWAYVRFGTVPAMGWLLYGVKPVILAVVVQAIAGLAPKAARTVPLAALGVLAAASSILGVHEIAVIFAAGGVAMFAPRGAPGEKGEGALRSWTPLFSAVLAKGGTASVTLPSLFWIFAKTGSVLFGSGYVLLAFLRADLVERLGWLTEGQLIDAIAVGQVTPGPVFTTATFIGYVLGGPSGAVVATAGIFLPAFVFVALSGPLVPKIRASPSAGAFLDGVNVASLALMAVVAMQLGHAAIVDPTTVVLAAASAIALLVWKPNATWLVLGGAWAGWAAHIAGIAHVASP
jgi:chromate transporter